MPYKELVGATSVRQGMSGVLAISCQGGKRSKKPDSRVDDRLIHTSQKVWERPRNISRSG